MTSKQFKIAMILNLLALPGAGHFYAKLKKRAFCILGIMILNILVVMYNVFVFTQNLIKQNQNQTHLLLKNVNAITQSIIWDPSVVYPMLFFILMYLLSALDLIWIYKKQNQ